MQRGLDSGQVAILGSGPTGDEEQEFSSKQFSAELDQLRVQSSDKRLRVQVDISRLLSLLPPDEGYSAFSKLATMCRGARAVLLGVVSPRAAAPEQPEKLRASADGIVRVWTEGYYSYLQVVKTVNSARTPAYAINETPKPPFLEIILE